MKTNFLRHWKWVAEERQVAEIWVTFEWPVIPWLKNYLDYRLNPLVEGDF